MSTSFDANAELIFVDGEIEGPKRSVLVHLALDTGSTSTLVNPELLASVGYDLDEATESAQIATVSGVEQDARLVPCIRLTALGESRE